MDELNIGKKIQGFRSARNLSVRELSSMSGITASMLSQIERDLVNPSINTLKSISKALEVPIFFFFKDDTDTKDLIVRKDKRKTIGFPDQKEVTYDLLTPDVNGSIEFCMMYIPYNSDSVEVAQSHNGEEVAYVMEGIVDIVMDRSRYTLVEGDSIRIPALSEHKWENHNQEMVKVIFAITPPSF